MQDQRHSIADYDTALLSSSVSWLLVFAHPGHELRAYHLIERVHPSIVALTDGSGSTPESRVEDSRAVIAHAGGRLAEGVGHLTDREAYTALMAVDPAPFLARVDDVVKTLCTENVEAVLVDAAEGYNPVHDICHWIGRAAVSRVRQLGVEVSLFEVDLVAHPDSPGDGLRLTLDDQAHARKLDAVSRYAALRGEAEAAFDRYGQDAFRVEFLRGVVNAPAPPASWIPYYEEVGEARVREGRYPTVLRYASHVKPVIETLLASVRPARHATDLRPLHE